jgi:hypothetical protein
LISVKENHGFHEDDVIAEHMIPTTFNEGAYPFNNSNLDSLKRHYMTFYWKVHQDFLDIIEDSMSHDSLMGSTFNPRSHKAASCVSKITSPIGLSHDTKTSKVSEKQTHMNFTLRTSILHFDSKRFEGYRNNTKIYGALLSACQSGVGRRIWI